MRTLLILIGKPLTLLLRSAILFALLVSKLRFRPTSLIIATIILFAISIFVYNWYQLLPPISNLTNPPSQTTKILDRNGDLLYQIYRDENRTLVKLSELPPHLIKATLAIEDKNFFTHKGIDLGGISRAFVKNINNCRFFTRPCNKEGGSTLTQQLIKNTLLSPEKTIDRKLKEIALAILAEQNYSKEKILELYLNQVNYGGTAYGIEAASQLYFNKSATNLTLSESALLAGLTTSPTTLSPLGSSPYLAKNRQKVVLNAMVENGFISSLDAQSALDEPVILKPKNISIAAPHFVMLVKEQLVNELGEELVAQGGLIVTTTLDLNYQRILEKNISQELASIKSLNVNNGAGIITNPQTGEVLAMAGSHNYYDYEHDGQVNVTTSPRQPGSSIKILTYALALMSGLTPQSMLTDSPICFKQLGSSPYCPQNYDGKFHGRINLKTALASSYNIPAVKLLNSLGVDKMLELGKTLGISTWQDSSRYGLALTLGGGEVKMTDMAEVYGTFANKGTHSPLKTIVSITNSKNEVINLSPSQEAKQVIPEIVAYQLSTILSDNNNRAPSFGYNSVLNINDHQVAVKTGTTNNLRDNWTFGYTQNYLVGTWVGNNDNSPMTKVASGITGASPIWRKVMDQLLKDKPRHVFTPPPNAKKVQICKSTQTIYCHGICPDKPIYEYFTPGTEPKGNCQNLSSGTITPEAATN